VESGSGAAVMQLLRDRHEVLHETEVQAFVDRRNLPMRARLVLDFGAGPHDTRETQVH
jgi:hypothetical protein